MICSVCGGPVFWEGPLVALTHTECSHCGAINAQLPEDDGNDLDTMEEISPGYFMVTDSPPDNYRETEKVARMVIWRNPVNQHVHIYQMRLNGERD